MRWLASGELAFLGRVDEQVKVRGYRVELGDIEASVRQAPGVSDAVVRLEAGEVSEHLVAYVVVDTPVSDRTAWTEDLTAYVAQHVPAYMVPQHFHALAQLPLTPNGKVDVKALEALVATETTESGYRAPQTDVENALAAIWQAVLKRDNIGIDDNFFALGGDSILSLQVIARAKRAGYKLTPKLVFENPTLVAMAEAIEHAAKSAQPQNAVPVIQKAPADSVIPLSSSQQRLWFLQQFEGANSVYNMALGIGIQGDVDKACLEKCFSMLVERHQSLRSYFVNESGVPRQVLHELNEQTSIVQHHDLKAMQAESIKRAQTIAAQAKAQVFHIDQDWLFNVNLIELEENRYWLLINLHHLIADGWSLRLLISEFAQLYNQLITGDSTPLPPLNLQYSDYAYWQQHTGQEQYQKQLSYWRDKLADVPPLLNLPTDRPRPPRQSYQGAAFNVGIDTQQALKLQQLAVAHNATPYMVLMACWQILLHRYSGQQDICIGTPVANRHLPDTQSIVGFFANTLVIRGRFDTDPTLVDFLSQIKTTMVEAQANQDTPFETLVDTLNVPRDASYSPLFQTMLTWGVSGVGEVQSLNSDKGRLSFFGLEDELATTRSRFDLDLNLRESKGGISGIFTYNTDLFEEKTLKKMWQHFQCILQAYFENPTYRVSEINLLAENEKSLFDQWNHTQISIPELGVEELFEQQVKTSGTRLAASFGEHSLTYGQLNALANRIAKQLVIKGVKPGQLVGIYQRRSLAMLASVLGVWKAGAAYVPLDPNYPSERITYMMSDASLELILVNQNLAKSEILSTHDVSLINVDDFFKEDTDSTVLTETEAFNERSAEAQPDDLAYVIYTSGSTGKPKGVELTRRNATNFIQAMQQLLSFKEEDRLLAVTSLSFDISILELFLPLVCGAEVVIGDETLSLDGEGLKQTLRQGITIMQATPVTWKVLLAAGWQPDTSAQYDFKVLCGGEAFPVELAKMLGNFPLDIWNMYGPTETTVWSAACKINDARKLQVRSQTLDNNVPIGRPIGNTQLFVLDKHLQRVPVGVVGNLYIGGAGVAKGYRGQASLTTERFIESEYGRIYNTGDLARYRANGVLECLGRSDTQVKVRGFRIELEEIESKLLEHPNVTEVAVNPMLRSGEPLLVAYVVLMDDAKADINQQDFHSEMVSWLTSRLPAYMVPSLTEILSTLPLTPNGKVDRGRLPQPTLHHRNVDYLAPRSETEKIVCDIWCEVLALEKIGVNENFFELGGHSLLATKLVARCQEHFYVKLPLAKLFRAPTIAGVALLIDEGQADDNNGALNHDALDLIDDLLAEYEP
ncbi:MAG: amino acid adenylation domain-containing protein [Pseudomonadota bacterium]